MINEIVDHYSLNAQLGILMEECAELIRACNKYQRARGYGYKTYYNEREAKEDIIKEIAHVTNAIFGVQRKLGFQDHEVAEYMVESDKKAVEMLHDIK